MKVKANIYQIITLFLITTILSFTSCKKEADLIGLNTQPSSDKLDAQYTDTISIVAYSVLEDSVRSDETTDNLLGRYIDPIFGKTNASFYTQIRLSNNDVDFGTTPLLDSLILSLVYTSPYYYGDTTTQLTVNVYRIKEDLYIDSAYYSNRSFTKDTVRVASYSFTPNLHKSVTINGETLPPQLRIKMDTALGNAILKMTSEELSDNDHFLTSFKGLFLTISPTSSNGAILYFDLENAYSQMTIYYRNSTQLSLSYNFVINEKCARFNHFDHDYTNADAAFRQQVINKNTSLGEQVLYLQAMGGVKTKIFFPHIKNFKALSTFAISKAELVISNYESTSSFAAPIALALTKLKSDGTNAFLPDDAVYEGETYFGGSYNSATNEYRFRLNKHIQQLISTNDVDHGMALLVSGSAVYANRLLMNGPKQSNNKMRLLLTYTILK